MSNNGVVRYSEYQPCEWWVYLMLFVTFAVSGFPFLLFPAKTSATLSISVYALIPIVLGSINFLFLRIAVYPNKIVASFGMLIPFYSRTIHLADVVTCAAVHYAAIAEYGGWGIKSNRRGDRVINMRGNEGVQLVFRNGQKLLIGSDHASTLAAAISPLIPMQSQAF